MVVKIKHGWPIVQSCLANTNQKMKLHSTVYPKYKA